MQALAVKGSSRLSGGFSHRMLTEGRQVLWSRGKEVGLKRLERQHRGDRNRRLPGRGGGETGRREGRAGGAQGIFRPARLLCVIASRGMHVTTPLAKPAE